MLTIKVSKQYKTDFKKLSKKDKELVLNVVNMLANEQELPISYEDHNLKGKWSSYRDCHIRPNLVLIYCIDVNELVLKLIRVGNHSNLKLTTSYINNSNKLFLKESQENNFNKKEVNKLAKELEKYFQELPIAKYYNVLVEPIDDDNKEFRLVGYIEYGDKWHDHKYFNEKTKEFFKSKDIDVDIVEEEKDSDDTIYSSNHIITKK